MIQDYFQQIVHEFQKTNIKFNGLTNQDLKRIMNDAEQAFKTDKDAAKIVIIAIKKAKANNWKTTLSIQQTVDEYISAGLLDSDDVIKYEQDKADKAKQPRLGPGQHVEATNFTLDDDEISTQANRVADLVFQKFKDTTYSEENLGLLDLQMSKEKTTYKGGNKADVMALARITVLEKLHWPSDLTRGNELLMYLKLNFTHHHST
ncbi:hypothetical protein [Weissella soli]|uniref:Uncharacterized protein n=1 Tax=Weissella soli TaxID=155866 RepID=A0A288QWS6_9LACO|nr:hypothetical protein [Weissella soli]AOT56583.1 hypothetical protein WSWS_00952 [Weissella soli]NKY83036.1 hypothetical protein [Weissella soli]RDL12149.1 hypothetical protein DFP99_0581 [Weissella soli]GEN92615.1 hypothetical protein WSO01_02270 [Weissella soli]